MRGWGSHEDFADDFAVDVGESVIAAEVASGEFEVIDAEQVEQGGVEIVDVDSTGHDAVAEVIGFAVGEAGFDSAAGHPGAEALGLVFASVLIDGGFAAEVLAPGGASKLAAPEHERVFEQAACFEVFQEGSNGLIGLGAEFGKIATNVAVMVPSADGDLHETDAGFAELACEEAGAGEGVGVFSVDAVEIERGLGFVRKVDDARGVHLHAGGEFHVLDHAFHVGVALEV